MSAADLASPKAKQGSKGLHISLWIVQVLLALAFLPAGVMKLITPWSPENPVPLLLFRFIGVAEVTGAIGLVVPALTRIKPGLTPLAACGLALVMLLATGFHLVRGEPIVTTAVLGLLAIFVAWGRMRAAPIHPR